MLKLKNIHKSYQQGSQEFPILKGIDLHVKEGDFLAIMGPSGSGKSTLMNIIGCLDKASAGSYHIEGTDVSDLSDNQLSDLRNQKIGFVFQNFNLMPKLTACQNVELPLTYMKVPKKRDASALWKCCDWSVWKKEATSSLWSCPVVKSNG